MGSEMCIRDSPDHKLPEMSSKIVAAIAEPYARIVEARVQDEDGNRVDKVRSGTPIRLHTTVRVERDYPDPGFRFQIAASDGRLMFISDLAPLAPAEAPGGQVLDLESTVENRLPPGRYTIACDVFTGAETPAGPTKMVRLEVQGDKRGGSMLLDHDIKVSASELPPAAPAARATTA